MPADSRAGAYAFIVLLQDPDDARGLSRLLEDVRLPEPNAESVFAAPPVRGVDFFAADAEQLGLDEWWGVNVPRAAHPVYLLMHEERLPDWQVGVDGTFYVGVPDAATAEHYRDSQRTQAFVAAGPLDFATAVMRDFSGGNGSGDLLFDEGEAMRMAALSSSFPIQLASSTLPTQAGDLAAGGFDADGGGRPAAYPDPPSSGAPLFPSPPVSSAHAVASHSQSPWMPQPEPIPNPFDLLAASGPSMNPGRAESKAELAPASRRGSPAGSPAGDSAPRGGASRIPLPGFIGFGALLRGGGTRSGYQVSSDRELAQVMVARAPTIVVMGSRKGGVGKTSYAAGVAIVAGTVLDQLGHAACIVDANIANPDAWGQMNLREGAATVREVVAALTGHREPPLPVHATTPALACYPESREASEYSKTEIRRFAEYLRRRYSFIVVDMSNRLPDPMAGPEAAAAAFWMEHGDVLVLPTTSAKADFNGVLDYLDVRDRPPTVVPYIVPSARRLRDNPVTREYLRVIRERVQRVVDIPDEANIVRLAGMEGVPVEQLSPRLRLAYRELTEVIARMPPRP